MKANLHIIKFQSYYGRYWWKFYIKIYWNFLIFSNFSRIYGVDFIINRGEQWLSKVILENNEKKILWHHSFISLRITTKAITKSSNSISMEIFLASDWLFNVIIPYQPSTVTRLTCTGGQFEFIIASFPYCCSCCGMWLWCWCQNDEGSPWCCWWWKHWWKWNRWLSIMWLKTSDYLKNCVFEN